MERRGHQHARARHSQQGINHILRVKRPPAPKRATAVQGQQKGRFKTVAVLHRHRAHQHRVAAQQAQPFGLCPPVGDQHAPGFAVGLRQTGRAGGEQHRRYLVGWDQRYVGDRLGVWRGQIIKGHARQVQVVKTRVGDRKGPCVIPRELAQGLGRMGSRLQAGFARQQAGCEHHREVVTVFAQVDDPGRGLQGARHGLRLRQKHRHRDRASWPPGQHIAQRQRADQGQSSRAHAARCAAMCWQSARNEAKIAWLCSLSERSSKP